MAAGDYDRIADLKRFDETKTGVKGILESNPTLTTIPRIFIHPPETLADFKPSSSPSGRRVRIPVVDLSSPSRSAEIAAAARDFGFFQVINHGVPPETLSRTVAAVKAFHEQPPETRSALYRRGMGGGGVSYLSNVDLFHSKAASWRDTLTVRLPPPLGEVPEICAAEVEEWGREVARLGGELMELVGEGLGLGAARLRELTCDQGRTMVGHYYPFCPQPDRTVGIASHVDPGVLTVLMQGDVGGLQVKHGDEWLDVDPLPGALVINIGDLLQMMSNDAYKSVEHRVVANSKKEPRVSIAVFFNPSDRDGVFGPLPELTSPEKPPIYRQFTYTEFIMKFFSRELDGKSLRNFFRI